MEHFSYIVNSNLVVETINLHLYVLAQSLSEPRSSIIAVTGGDKKCRYGKRASGENSTGYKDPNICKMQLKSLRRTK